MAFPRRFAWFLALLPALGLTIAVGCVGDDPAPPAEITCLSYCSQIAQSCTGEDAQFPDNATCLRFCGTYAVKGLGQNTIECRLSALSSLKEAQTPAEKHLDCGNAGVASPLCPNRCEGFCAANLALCGTKSAATPERYVDLASCKTACAGFKDANATVFPGQLIGSSGDNLQCRTYHMELSQTGNAIDLTTHCPHTIPENKSKCNDGTPPGDGGTDGATTDGSSADAASE